MPSASGYYTVKQGEWLSRIARQFGILNWKTIWDHPLNQDLQNLRKSPNILFPGDRVFIPAIEDKIVSAVTDKKHPFITSKGSLTLRLRLYDEDKKPRAGASYTLQAGRLSIEAQTDGDGLIVHDLDPAVTSAVLTIDRHTTTLLLGHLDPITEVSGVQARLLNLGYRPGEIDGIEGPKTKRAIRAFQRDSHPLKVDGVCGSKTRQRLLEVHGC